MCNIDHRKIIENCLQKKASDITPISLWRHFPVDDFDPFLFAKAVITFQNQFNFDIVKVTPASCYSTYDWGTTDEWLGNPEGSRENRKPVIKTPDDWLRLKKLDVNSGFIGAQLNGIRLIRQNIDFHTPIIQTIFSPLSQAKHLAGNETVIKHMQENPEELLYGLEVINNSTKDFIEVCQKIDVDGFFYAVQHAQKSIITPESYKIFGSRFDKHISEAIQNSWLNMLHIHGQDIYFDLFTDLSFQIINWHDRHTKPSLVEARQQSSTCFCGGIRQWESLVSGNPRIIQEECNAAIMETGNLGFILGTGCVTPLTAPWGNIQAVIDTARKKL